MRCLYRVALWIITLALASVAPATAMAGIGPTLSVSAFAGTCIVDDEISAADRTAIQAAALSFLEKFMGGHIAEAFAEMAAKSRSGDGLVALEGVARQFNVNEPYTDFRVIRTYVADVATAGEQPVSVPCGDLSDSNRRDVLQLRGKGRQAFVWIAADAVHDEWAFTLFLRQEGGVWKVDGVYRTMSKMAGHDFADVWTRAKKARAANHAFAAATLYALADILSDRGPIMQPGILQGYRPDRASASFPAEMTAAFPHAMTFGAQTFEVSAMQVIGFEKGKIGLVFYWQPTTWTDQSGAETMNRGFIDAFRAAHPDWSEAGSAIVARAFEPGKATGWGTVYELESGYDPPNH